MLPKLQDWLIAPCFRKVTTITESETGRVVDTAGDVKTCLESSVLHYGQILMGVAAIISFAYIVRAGYTMFTAFGDEAKYAQGKKTLLYAVIGLAIAVASGFIINFFVSLLGYKPTL